MAHGSWSAIKRRYTTRDFRRALRTLLLEFQLQRRHYAGVRRARRLSVSDDLEIQFGPGSRHQPGWINIDLFAPGADYALDLRDVLPFPDNVASLIQSARPGALRLS